MNYEIKAGEKKGAHECLPSGIPPRKTPNLFGIDAGIFIRLAAHARRCFGGLGCYPAILGPKCDIEIRCNDYAADESLVGDLL
jgi:hypothetical protein